MHFKHALGICAAIAFMLPVAAQATPSLSCTVAATPANRTTFPQGCAVTLTSGPITFTNVADPTGHLHNITINSLTATNGANGFFNLTGTNFNQFNSTTGLFNFSTDNSDSTSTDPGLNTFPFGVTDNFTLTSLNIAADAPAFNFPINWDIKLEPGPVSTVSSTAIDNGNGTYTITSFFDIFFELSLDANLTTPHFTAQNGGPAVAQIKNIPEPITLSLFGAGLAGAAAMRRRKPKA